MRLLLVACRKGEALAQRFEDYSLDNNTWTIRAEHSKSKKRRVVPLNAGALAILEDLAESNTSEWR